MHFSNHTGAKIVLRGILKKTPQIKYTHSGIPFADINVIIYKDSYGNENIKDNFQVTVWEDDAHHLIQNAQTGAHIEVIGDISQETIHYRNKRSKMQSCKYNEYHAHSVEIINERFIGN